MNSCTITIPAKSKDKQAVLTNEKIMHSLATHIKESNVSCTSMTVTIFGDVVSQHGGWIWLGSLINCMAPLGFNDRAVRTSAFRLVQNGLLDVKKIGRKSYYCFTENAKTQYDRISRKMYASEPAKWDNRWLFVLINSVPEEKREELKKGLNWQGFNMLTTNLYAHPSSDRESLDELLSEQEITQDVAIFSASTQEAQSQEVIRSLVSTRWDIEELAQHYQEFLTYYRNLIGTINVSVLNSEECFVFRSALIHDYRKIQLKDPDLPTDLLPSGWVGFEALDLVKRLYKALAEPSLEYVEQALYNAQGTLPTASDNFFERFGGM